MGKRRNNVFNDTLAMNRKTYNHYLRRLTELATTSIKWNNLPETIDERFLEMVLYNKGMAVFFRDEVLGFLCLEVMIGGSWNVYNTPNQRTAFATNGYQVNLTPENSVIIFNNFLRTPSIIDMELYALRLYEIERALDVNIKGQKTPKIITCSENQRLVMQNLMMQYEGNFPFIFGDKSLETQGLSSIDTASPFVADKLQIVKRQIFNEALTFLGIENNSNEKEERLVTNESISNLGSVQAARVQRLASREQACRQINDMFGLNISVDFKTPLSIDSMLKKGEENGEVYDRTQVNL